MFETRLGYIARICLKKKNKEGMINIWGDRYIYYDLNIIQCIHISKHYMDPHKYV
jgi:hypothetical protein